MSEKKDVPGFGDRLPNGLTLRPALEFRSPEHLELLRKINSARHKLPGANTYGVPFAKWAAMTNRQKCALKQKICEARRKLDPERYAKFRKRNTEASARYYAKRNREGRRRKPTEALHLLQRAWGQRRRMQMHMKDHPERTGKLIASHVPAGLPAVMREEVIGMLCLAALDRKVRFDELAAAVKEAITKYIASTTRSRTGRWTLRLAQKEI